MRGADLYIASGILELYVAGVLLPEEIEEVQAMAAKYDTVAEEIKRIEYAHLKYAKAHSPGLSGRFYENLAGKISELPVTETPAPEPVKSNRLKPQLATPKEKPVPVNTPRPQQPVREKAQSKSNAGFYFLIGFLFLLFILTSALSYYLYDKWQRAENNLVQMHTENSTIARQNDSLKLAYEEAFAKLAPYNSPDVKKISLKGLDIASQASALVYWNPKNSDVYLQIENLPQPPAGKQYQLWAVDTEDKYMDAGMITNLENSVISPMRKITNARSFAISLEPEGGSSQPTLNAVYARSE